MKKRIFVFICIFAVFLGACGKKQTEDYEMSKDIAAPTDETDATTENEVQETVPEDSRSESEKTFESWVEKMVSEEDLEEYSKLFDPEIFTLEQIKYIRDTLQGEYSYRIFYEDPEEIICMIQTANGSVRGYMDLCFVEDRYIATDSQNAAEIFSLHCCSECGGSGQVVSGSHIENSQNACGICGGSGFVQNQYYDAIMGWQTTMMGCSGCGGAGYLNGAHTVFEYADCASCEGFGVI